MASKRSTAKIAKKATPAKTNTMELLNSYAGDIEKAMNHYFKRSTENISINKGIKPHRWYEKKAVAILERFFARNEELSHLKLDYNKKKSNEYPDFPAVVDSRGNRYAIDVKTNGGRIFNNDILQNTNPKKFKGEFLVFIPFDNTQKMVKKSYRGCLFVEPYKLARKDKNGYVALGGASYAVRPMSLRRFYGGNVVFESREHLMRELNKTIEYKVRTDRKFRTSYNTKIQKAERRNIK